MPAAGLTALSAALRTRDPGGTLSVARAPGGSCRAAPSCGRDRYRPDRPLSRVLHLHQAWLEAPRTRKRPSPWAASSEFVHKPLIQVHLHQVRLEDVGPRTGPASLGNGIAPCKDLYPLILQLVLSRRGLLPCDSIKVRGGGPSPSPSCEFPGADPATGLTSSVPRREASKALRPDPYAVSAKSSSGRTFRSASPSTTGTLSRSHSRGSPPRG